MCQLDSLTREQLQGMTKLQLINAVLANRPPTPDLAEDTLDAQGRLIKRVTTFRDGLGDVVLKTRERYAYNADGTIHTIKLVTLDPTADPPVVIGKTRIIYHYYDGRQPTAEQIDDPENGA